jgi:hypothetical protein
MECCPRIERVADRLFEGEEAVLHVIERIVAHSVSGSTQRHLVGRRRGLVDFHPCWAEPRSLAHPVKNNLRGPRIAYTVCDLLPPSVYRPVSRNIPTSTARSVRSSSQSISSSAKVRLSG